MKLKGRNAVVTGGSQGFGRAIVKAFLGAGANVCFCSRTASDVAKTEAELRSKLASGQRLAGLACDVSSPGDVARLFSTATTALGELHALVNNAGVYGPIGPSEDVDWSEWRKAVEINLYGTLLPCRQIIPRFKQRGYGKIINISGGGATNPMPRLSAYAASKAAVVRLTETLAEELREFHIDVNAVAPGALKTRFVDQVIQAGPERAGPDFYARNRSWFESGGTPLELGAGLCVYLASAESDGITGKLISAQWDPWERLHQFKADLASDIYTLRRIVPKDRGKGWGDK
jgi:3-oxoacyl-[acyl-carrier protein] reductase